MNRPGNKLAMEGKFHGTNWPGCELARVLLADLLQGANWQGIEKARNCGDH